MRANGTEPYYRLQQDRSENLAKPSWFLSIDSKLADGTWWDVWAYRKCLPASPPPYPFYISESGSPSEINFAGAYGILVVSQRVGAVFSAIAKNDIQQIPVLVNNSPAHWEIINPLTLVDCLDEEKSVIKPYYPLDFHRPELAGKPRGIIRLRIDPNKVDGHHVFRISNWMGPVIISRKLADALLGVTTEGYRLDPVTE